MNITISGHALATAALGLVSAVLLVSAAFADQGELAWFSIALSIVAASVYFRGLLLTTVREVVSEEVAGQIAHARIFGVVPAQRRPASADQLHSTDH